MSVTVSRHFQARSERSSLAKIILDKPCVRMVLVAFKEVRPGALAYSKRTRIAVASRDTVAAGEQTLP